MSTHEAVSIFHPSHPPFLMRRWRDRICLLVVVAAALGCFPPPTTAQESGKVVIPLRIARPYEQPMMVSWITFDEGKPASAPQKMEPGTVRLGRLPGGVRAAVETIAESPQAYRVKVDTDGDQDLADESPMVLNLDSPRTVEVTRQLPNRKPTTLPYTIAYRRSVKGQQAEELFFWKPHYVAEGRLKIGACEADVKVLDVNGDAVFDRQDFRRGTTIHIDDGSNNDVINKNDPRIIKYGDGRIKIPEEMRRSMKRKWHRGEEIIEVCGGSYAVDNVEADGSGLTLAKSRLKIPTVGEALPTFAMTTLDGQVIDSRSLKGAITLLDFWASWCQPCVEKFGEVKRIAGASEGKLRVIAINVDERARLSAVHQVIKEYTLTWPHVATGQGERDPLWKVFGSMSNNGLSIPFYVLVDAKGIIRYAGSGDEDLAELRAKVKELVLNKPVPGK